MSEATKPVVPSLDWKSAEQYLKDIKAKIFEYKGKQGYNPFVWWKKSGAEASEKKFEKGERTPELHKAITSLKFSPPRMENTLLAEDDKSVKS